MIDILNYLLALSAVFSAIGSTYHAGTDEPLKKSVR